MLTVCGTNRIEGQRPHPVSMARQHAYLLKVFLRRSQQQADCVVHSSQGQQQPAWDSTAVLLKRSEGAGGTRHQMMAGGLAMIGSNLLYFLPVLLAGRANRKIL